MSKKFPLTILFESYINTMNSGLGNPDLRGIVKDPKYLEQSKGGMPAEKFYWCWLPPFFIRGNLNWERNKK